MMPKAKMTVYLVIDRGGECGNKWSEPYMAFTDKQSAWECADKRTESGFYKRHYDPDNAWIDYLDSTVCAVDVLVDYFEVKEVSSDE